MISFTEPGRYCVGIIELESNGHTPEAAPLSDVSKISDVIPFNLWNSLSETLPSDNLGAKIKLPFHTQFVDNVVPVIEESKFNVFILTPVP